MFDFKKNETFDVQVWQFPLIQKPSTLFEPLVLNHSDLPAEVLRQF